MTNAKKLDPYDVEALERAVNDSATRVSAIWISFLVFSLYLLIAATTVTQRQLLLAEPVKLPALSIDLPQWGFFFLAPVLFVVLHSYVLLQVLLLGRTTAAYNTAVARADLSPEESASLRQRLANTLFAQIFAGSPRERQGFIGASLRVIVWITLAIGPVMILLAFQFSFLAYHSHLATWTHRLLILFELVAFFLIWPLALDAEKDFQWPNVGADIKRLLSMPVHMFGPMEMRHNGWVWLRERAISLSTCVLFVLVSLSIATFPGEPHVNLFTGKPLTSVQCERWLHQSFGFADLRFDRLAPGSGYFVDDERVAKIVKTISERRLAPWWGEPARDLRNRNLNCSEISGDFRHADLTGAQLLGAAIFFADFQGAVLTDARFQDAYLNGTQFRGAFLFRAQFQGAVLRATSLQDSSIAGAQFQGADLSMTEFQGGRLEDVQLQGAFLDGAQLQGASLENVQLQGATLDGAQLQGALFKDVRLQGASLKKVQLQGAMFDGVQLQGADLADTVLSSALLSHVWVWHAANADCTKARVIGRKPDSVIEIGGEVSEWTAKSSIPPAEATPSEISKFIERAVARIPDAGPLNKKAIIAARMHRMLDVEPAKDDTEAIAKRWSDCEEASVKIAREQFDKEHAKLLQKLVCDDLIAERKYIAQNIVSTWISETEDRRAFSAQLARGLLGEDGEHCAATKDFDEPVKERLHKVVEKMANASPAVPTPPTAPVQ